MSHEIRTPLNGIIGYSNLLKTLILEDDAQNYAKYIAQSSEYLLETVNQLLDLSKIQNTHFELYKEWFNSNKWFDSIKNIFVYDAKEKEIEFLFDVDKNLPNFIYIDSLKLKHILVNFISNAFKFTKKMVLVKIVVLEKSEDSVKISFCVKDDGIGIAEEKQEMIFIPFSQENCDTTKNYGGTGLGLATANELLTIMNSKITLNSKKGKGSEFKFTLHVPYLDEQIKEKTDEITINSNNLKFNATILVAEDNKINQMVITDTLKKYGINTICANDGEEAFKIYTENRTFNLVFMDLNMPILDGIKSTKKIIDFEKTQNISHTPIVALTANIILGEKQKCVESGMDDYLAKPFNILDMENILKKYIPDFEKIYSTEQVAKSLGIPKEKMTVYIQKFLKQVDIDIEVMQEAIMSLDYVELENIAHRLKGTAGLLSINDIYKIFDQIENNAIEKREYDYQIQIDAINKILNSMRAI